MADRIRVRGEYIRKNSNGHATIFQGENRPPSSVRINRCVSPVEETMIGLYGHSICSSTACCYWPDVIKVFLHLQTKSETYRERRCLSLSTNCSNESLNLSLDRQHSDRVTMQYCCFPSYYHRIAVLLSNGIYLLFFFLSSQERNYPTRRANRSNPQPLRF